MQLIHLRAEDDVELVRWLKRKHYKYTSPQIQNEMLDSLALGIFQDIASSIQTAEFFSIMADETADISNQEQLVICIRWVDEELVVHEAFIGLRPVAETNASTITDAIKSILVEMNLDIMNARGQCYDGASTMRGHRTGVVPAIKSINGKCLYTHCYGHALNLAVSDAIKGVKVLSDAFDTVKEICKLVGKSPQRDTHLKFVKTSRENEAKSVHAFCPTRWTVRGETCQSILENHSELLELWEWSLENHSELLELWEWPLENHSELLELWEWSLENHSELLELWEWSLENHSELLELWEWSLENHSELLELWEWSLENHSELLELWEWSLENHSELLELWEWSLENHSELLELWEWSLENHSELLELWEWSLENHSELLELWEWSLENHSELLELWEWSLENHSELLELWEWSLENHSELLELWEWSLENHSELLELWEWSLENHSELLELWEWSLENHSELLELWK